MLESRIDEIASYINGVVYVSLDGLEKTHDAIRGVDGSFRKALRGISAAKEKVAVTINTTIMAENVDEIESLVKLTKESGTKISIAVAHEYCNISTSSPPINKTLRIAHRLIEMKEEGYPIVNSVGYLKVMAKEKDWHCRPWAIVNVDPNGNLVLPCYVLDDYVGNISIFENSIRNSVSDFDWKKIKNCRKCSLHCYVEPSLVLSGDFKSYIHWAFRINI